MTIARRLWNPLSILFLISGLVLVGVLFVQYLDVYFTIWTPIPAAEPSQSVRYEWTAALCIGVAVAAALISLFLGRGRRAIAGGLLVVVALTAAAVFAVPRDRWTAADTGDSHPLPSNYQPCYSGSNDCVGG